MAVNRFPYRERHPYPTRHNKREQKVAETAIYAVKKDMDEEFRERPTFHDDDGIGDPTGTTGDTNIMKTEQYTWEYHIKGTQTILAPTWSVAGLDISMDQTDNDGVEITAGITSRTKRAYTVGTDEPFFAECTLTIADVSGTDDCAFGFRKAEAYQANVDDYDEAAFLNVISGDVFIETILNNAATVSTDTTVDVADAGTVTLRLECGKDGRCKFYVNGTEYRPSAGGKFDSGEVVVPFLFFLHSADVAGTVVSTNWKTGRLYK